MSRLQTLRIKVYGIVQGVGFRPTVARHAAGAGVCGSVCNKGPYVEIYAQGSEEKNAEFLRLLEQLGQVWNRPPQSLEARVIKFLSQHSTYPAGMSCWTRAAILR